MLHSLIYSLLAIFFAYLSRFKSCKYGLEFAFFILVIFMGVRYEFGNDYAAYMRMFYENTSGNLVFHSYFIDILSSENSEFGWMFINMLFKPFGFFTMVFVITCFEYYVLYKLIKKYVSPRWYWFAIFLFTFNSGLMLTGGSMMRQYLAMTILLLSINYLIEGKLIKYIACILISSTIHTSSLFLIPFYWIRLIPQTISNRSFVAMVISAFTYHKIASYLFVILISYLLSSTIFERYGIYDGEARKAEGMGLGVLYYYCLFFIALKSGTYLTRNEYLLTLFSSLYILIIPFSELFPLAGRLGYYFTYFSVISLPLLAAKMPSRLGAILLVIVSIVFVLKLWYSFFYSDVWRDTMMEYKSIFSAPFWM